MTFNVDKLLRDTDLRNTPARRAIVGLIHKAARPVSAPEIMLNLEKENLLVNKTTVYRELAFLVKKHIVCEVYLKPDLVHYESALLPHHHHLVCDNCGRVEEIQMDESALLSFIKKTKFKVKRHSLEFFGLCPKCA